MKDLLADQRKQAIMRGSKQGIRAGMRLPGMKAGVVIVAGFTIIMPARAQTPMRTPAGEMMLFESAGAARVVEKVRSQAQGVMVRIFVKAGDPVTKGQVLGHADLDATKLQLDLARQSAESNAKLEAAKSQAEAWTVNREEIEEAVRKREAGESRLNWALAMERMYQAQYEAQLDARKTQRIQLEYWEKQYENRFFRAPVDGVVSEVRLEVGNPLNFAVHAFTVSNENTYMLPVTVPSPLAEHAVPNETLHVRSADGKSVSRALVDSVMDDPRSAGRKIVRLLVKAADLSATTQAHLPGMKFDVLMPQVAQESYR